MTYPDRQLITQTSFTSSSDVAFFQLAQLRCVCYAHCAYNAQTLYLQSNIVKKRLKIKCHYGFDSRKCFNFFVLHRVGMKVNIKNNFIDANIFYLLMWEKVSSAIYFYMRTMSLTRLWSFFRICLPLNSFLIHFNSFLTKWSVWACVCRRMAILVRFLRRSKWQSHYDKYQKISSYFGQQLHSLVSPDFSVKAQIVFLNNCFQL